MEAVKVKYDGLSRENAKMATHRLYAKHLKIIEICSKFFKNKNEFVRWALERALVDLPEHLDEASKVALELEVRNCNLLK